MNNNENLPVVQPKPETSEVRKASFWVSQICVIIATVLGVYLAATQGLKQAIAFDDIRSDKNNAYLRMSLRTEMAGNIEVVKDYVAKVRKDGSLASRKRALALQTFVWDNMKFSSNTLETPSEFLMANADFLRTITYLHGEIAGSGISTDNGLKRMEAAIKKLEETVLPKLDTNVEELRTSLKKRDIDI
ncbi:hypothetical protein M2447_001529 [Ereboglobus sp. PH5-10]|uniref:Chemotaxis methyl-accepting receptor HlyB-like 4HB MCP domain-containing protein n=1 Tax=Ereboglobus luteus TaxID=1796921 RepID=A0A2U8E2B2_9BACT|nr:MULTISPECIES: hypothetical protein [Ereboglobus]AWI08834.1 hypothetical protein CKA38_05825 [Ereboglobus luteus]MDF9827436.1 hypothetical protein [Ereboglobus sp. PH5-10]